MAPRLKPSIVLITALFVALIYILRGSLSGGETFIANQSPLPKHLAAGTAHHVQTKLESMVQTPMNISDLRSMGERTAAFTSLIEAVTADSNLDWNPVTLLLREQFPWLEDVEMESYTPLSKTAKMNTGIVICVGRKDFIYAIQLIRTLRVVIRSALPIETAHAGDSDLPTYQRDILKALDLRLDTINLLDYFDESTGGLLKGGYAVKPFVKVEIEQAYEIPDYWGMLTNYLNDVDLRIPAPRLPTLLRDFRAPPVNSRHILRPMWSKYTRGYNGFGRRPVLPSWAET